MSEEERSLEELRHLIDEIDDRCHDLLMERTRVVGQVGQAKTRERKSASDKPVLAMRPGREGQVLRRLVGRHRGALPVIVVARMWRELITAKTRLQGPLEVSVYGGGDALKIWDLARFHYGSATPMEMAASVQDILNMVSTEPGHIAVLPAPGMTGEPVPWWPLLCEKNTALRVVAGLPFLVEEGSRVEPQALTVACMEPEPSGHDRSLLAVTFDRSQTVKGAVDCLAQAGLPDVVALDVNQQVHLVSVSGFVGGALEDVAEHMNATPRNIRSICVLGSYACPISINAGGQVT